MTVNIELVFFFLQIFLVKSNGKSIFSVLQQTYIPLVENKETEEKTISGAKIYQESQYPSFDLGSDVTQENSDIDTFEGSE